MKFTNNNGKVFDTDEDQLIVSFESKCGDLLCSESLYGNFDWDIGEIRHPYLYCNKSGVLGKYEILDNIIPLTKKTLQEWLLNSLMKSDGFVVHYHIREFWEFISAYVELDEDTIEYSADQLNWDSISKFQTLSEEFIENHSDQVYWHWISCKQTLSEAFIERNANLVNWIGISSHQKLSKAFIERNADMVDWDALMENPNIQLSKQFIMSHQNKAVCNL